MDKTSIPKLLIKLSPPVMLALLIQSIYNIVDSFFVGQYSQEGLTALSIIFPVQLLITAVSTGTGTGINILISGMDGAGDLKNPDRIIKNGLFLGVFNFLVFAVIGLLSMKGYYQISSGQAVVREYGMDYGYIILIFSLGIFLEANFTKILQARGNMFVPMCAQVTGAIINCLLDPLLIFGRAGFPQMGVRGAAAATVIGQWAAMFIVGICVLKKYPLRGKISLKTCLHIYKTGAASIVMQSLYTLYIVGLNLILKQFTENAVTVLGIYYKIQTFFFIPMMGLQQVILPIISFNCGAGREDRVRQTVRYSVAASAILMTAAVTVFMAVPGALVRIFSDSPEVISIGCTAFRIISVSFIPAAAVMIMTVYFQGIGRGKISILITVLRQVFLLVPLAWLLHFFGLEFVWITFPATEIIVVIVTLRLYAKNRLVYS